MTSCHVTPLIRGPLWSILSKCAALFLESLRSACASLAQSLVRVGVGSIECSGVRAFFLAFPSLFHAASVGGAETPAFPPHIAWDGALLRSGLREIPKRDRLHATEARWFGTGHHPLSLSHGRSGRTEGHPCGCLRAGCEPTRLRADPGASRHWGGTRQHPVRRTRCTAAPAPPPSLPPTHFDPTLLEPGLIRQHPVLDSPGVFDSASRS